MSGITQYTLRLSDSNHPTDGYLQKNIKNLINHNNAIGISFNNSMKINIPIAILNTITALFKIKTHKSTMCRFHTNMCNFLTTMRRQNTNMCNRLTTIRRQNTNMCNYLTTIRSQNTNMCNYLTTIRSQNTNMCNYLTTIRSQNTNTCNYLTTIRSQVNLIQSNISL